MILCTIAIDNMIKVINTVAAAIKVDSQTQDSTTVAAEALAVMTEARNASGSVH